ncbi:hypothetical protein V3C99_016842 [Haemonchus contortus]|uniref:Secreted protein n=1 Tax=Haemonchus contortus TaxID=6289 RepID=A0A7I5EDN7_HAECO|nr:CRE-HEN-1 protein [Haemonchus contortus]
MPSSVLLAITFLVVVCSAKHRYDRSTRESLTEWRTTECTMLNGEQTEPCPSPGANGDWPCIRYSDLCNGLRDCPNGEDESPVHCHFHHLHRAELDSIREKLHRLNVALNRRTSTTTAL